MNDESILPFGERILIIKDYNRRRSMKKLVLGAEVFVMVIGLLGSCDLGADIPDYTPTDTV